MKIYEEIKISFVKPQFYYKLKDLKPIVLLRFQAITALAGFIFMQLYQCFYSILTGNFNKFTNSFMTITLSTLIFNLIYMWIGVIMSSLLLSLILNVVNFFKKINYLSFHNIYSYAAHSLFACVFVVNFFGPFVILFAIGYYLLAVKYERTSAFGGEN